MVSLSASGLSLPVQRKVPQRKDVRALLCALACGPARPAQARTAKAVLNQLGGFIRCRRAARRRARKNVRILYTVAVVWVLMPCFIADARAKRAHPNCEKNSNLGCKNFPLRFIACARRSGAQEAATPVPPLQIDLVIYSSCCQPGFPPARE